MSKRKWFAVLFSLFLLSVVASAADDDLIMNIVCSVIQPVYKALRVATPTLVGLMFMYGAVKYAFSADDPGGRKQAKSIMIHAVIAGILFGLITWVLGTVLGVNGLIDTCLKAGG